MPDRTPIGVAGTPEGDYVVICDDGAVFAWEALAMMRGGNWSERPPVPGTKRAAEPDAPTVS